MPHTKVARRLRYPWQELYALVLDVESYPSFVPFCRDMRLIERSGDNVVAQMEVGFATLRERYTSHIKGNRDNKEIILHAVDGPFKHLNGVWTFEPTSEHSTQVIFSIEYEFRSRFLSTIEAKAFKVIFGQLVNSFEKRASIVLHKF